MERRDVTEDAQPAPDAPAPTRSFLRRLLDLWTRPDSEDDKQWVYEW